MCSMKRNHFWPNAPAGMLWVNYEEGIKGKVTQVLCHAFLFPLQLPTSGKTHGGEIASLTSAIFISRSCQLQKVCLLPRTWPLKPSGQTDLAGSSSRPNATFFSFFFFFSHSCLTHGVVKNEKEKKRIYGCIKGIQCILGSNLCRPRSPAVGQADGKAITCVLL